MEVSFTKLRSGDWGVRVKGSVKPKQWVTVATRSGRSSRVQIDRIIWQGEGAMLCSVIPENPHQRGVRTDRCRGCGGPYRDADHHIAMEGYCGHCAFDEFDI